MTYEFIAWTNIKAFKEQKILEETAFFTIIIATQLDISDNL